MSEEGEGSAADFARLLTGVQSEPVEPSTEPQSEAGQFAPKAEPDRAVLEAAEDAGRARLQEAGLHSPTKAERNRALVEALHPTPREEPDQMTDTDDREELARLVLGDPKLAPLVTGDTVKEMAASAAEVGRLLRGEGERQTRQQAAERVDFDGGPRTPAPVTGPTHEEWLVSVFQNMSAGGGSD